MKCDIILIPFDDGYTLSCSLYYDTESIMDGDNHVQFTSRIMYTVFWIIYVLANFVYTLNTYSIDTGENTISIYNN